MIGDSSTRKRAMATVRRRLPRFTAPSGVLGVFGVGYSGRCETFRCSIVTDGELMAAAPMRIPYLVAMGVGALAVVVGLFFLVRYRRSSKRRSRTRGAWAPQRGKTPVDRDVRPSGPGGVEPGSASTTREESPGPLTERGEFTLLCVHDDSRAYKALARKIKAHGIRMVNADDAETAYLACFSERPGALLIDSTVPNADCRRVLERVRSHPFVATIPTIVVTKQQVPEADRLTAAMDGLRCLTKPIDVEELINTLSSRAPFHEFVPQHLRETVRISSTPDASTGASIRTSLHETAVIPPTREPEPVVAEHDNPTKQTTPEKRPKVLCIDDDPNVSKALMTRLRPYGVDVIRAFNGMQGFWTGLDTRPDVIIIDLKMPDGEGDYVFSRFQSHPLTENVPVIILTGEANLGVKRKLLGMGAANFFTKPWNFDELLLELKRHIDLRAADSREHVPAPN